MKVLVIEENQQLVKDISFCLQVRYQEIEVFTVDKGERGVDVIESEMPDLVMVDSTLPDISCLELINKIREFSDVPLIVLTEVTNDIELARYLETGADEYINKPFSPIELLARVRALLRRVKGFSLRTEQTIDFGHDLSINFATQEVFLAGNRINLTPTEYHLLTELVRNEGKVITHSTLLEKVWGPEYTQDPGFVKKYVYRLRSKLEPDASKPQMLLTERGIGYKFTRVV